MTPERTVKIYTIRVTHADTGFARITSFLAQSRRHAMMIYEKHHKDFENEAPLKDCEITITTPSICDCHITEAHCTHYGDIIQRVAKGRTNNDFYNDEHTVITPELIRGEYNPVNHSYTCFDPDGKKVYLDPYDWVIIKKKEN
jgi:hypothetical protein